PNAQPDHDAKCKSAIYNRRDTEEHIIGELGRLAQKTSAFQVNVQVYRNRNANDQSQQSSSSGYIERSDDGIEYASFLTDVKAALRSFGHHVPGEIRNAFYNDGAYNQK